MLVWICALGRRLSLLGSAEIGYRLSIRVSQFHMPPHCGKENTILSSGTWGFHERRKSARKVQRNMPCILRFLLRTSTHHFSSRDFCALIQKSIKNISTPSYFRIEFYLNLVPLLYTG